MTPTERATMLATLTKMEADFGTMRMLLSTLGRVNLYIKVSTAQEAVRDVIGEFEPDKPEAR